MRVREGDDVMWRANAAIVNARLPGDGIMP
jgi:hypothetical protein